MDKTNNKINSAFSFEDLSKSYRWSQNRNTFPANYWNEILFNFLYNGMSTTEIEKKYRGTLPGKRGDGKRSNNMYISVLINRLLLNSKSKGTLKNKKYSIEKVKSKINEYVDGVLQRGLEKYGEAIHKNWKSQIKRWRELLMATQNPSRHYENTKKNIKSYIDHAKKKMIVVEYKFGSSKMNKEKYTYDENTCDEYQKERIGQIGEEIVMNALVDKYGFNNVFQTSKFDKYSPYDFEINDENGQKRYIEVKSTTKVGEANWYISRRELEFQKQHNKQYDIYFVKNVFVPSKITNDDVPVISYVKNPVIKVDANSYGFDGNSFIVTPRSYKGLM